MKKLLLLLLSVLIAPLIVCAQHQRARIAQPKTVLVQLGSQQNRMKYFQGKTESKMYGLLVKETDTIMKVTINDFKDHFNFCPVYYFYDTNYALIAAKKFDGVLLDENRNPVQSPVIAEADTNYLIVYFGTRTSDMSSKSKAAPASNASAKGLVVLDYRFKNMPRKFPRFIRTYDAIYKRHDPKYNFTSDHFDMGYRESAKRFNEYLMSYYLPKKGNK